MDYVLPAILNALPKLNAETPRYYSNQLHEQMPGTDSSWWQGGDLYPLFKQGPGNFLLRETLKADVPLLKVNVGPKPIIIVRDPNLIKTVLMDKEGRFERDTSPVKEVFERGLLSLSGTDWAKRRQLLADRFHLTSVSPAIPLANQSIEKLIASWKVHAKDASVIRPSPDLAWMMLEILGQFAFGVQLDREKHGGKALHRALIILTKDAMKRCFSPVPYWKIVPSTAIKQARNHMQRLAEEIITLAQINRAETGPDERASATLMSVLLEAKKDGLINHDDVIGEVISFLIAGHETSATALAWILHIFTGHPEILERCRQEADTILGNDLTAPTLSDLEQLQYINSVVKEAMRLYPPVPLSSHITCKDTDLGGYWLPRKTNLLISSMITHRDPLLWRNPNQFDPQRFIAPDVEQHRFQYIPFLMGPHTCIGLHLAQIELVLATARLAQSFKFVAAGEGVDGEIRVSLYPNGLAFFIEEVY